MTPNHVVQLTDALIALFDPVVQAVDDVNCAEALLRDMGYKIPPGQLPFLNDLTPLLEELIDVINEADDLVRGDTQADHLALFKNLVEAVQDLTKSIRDIGPSLQRSFPADFLVATNIVAQFPGQLADYLIVRMIEERYPVLHSSLVLTGFFDEREAMTAATPFNVPYKKRAVRWNKLGDYVGNPLPSIQEAYGWNTESFDYGHLIGNLHRFGQSIRFFSSYTTPEPDTLQALNGGTDVVTDDNADKLAILTFPLLPILDSPIGAEIYPVLNPAKDKAAGLGLGLYFDPAAGISYPVSDDVSLGIKYTGTGALDAGVLIFPNQPLQLVSNIFGGSGPQADLSSFVPEFIYSNAGEKTLLFHSSLGAKLEFASWIVRAGVHPGLSGFYLETDLRGATLTISSEGADGFLKEILPSKPMALDFDLVVGFSSKSGLYFGGSVGLEIKIPAHLKLGPVALDGIAVSLKPSNGKIPLMLGTDVSARIGPMNVVVQNVGAQVVLSFPEKRDGNAGPMQVDLGFKPPSGAGISIDAAGVTGGGSLFFFPQTGLYAGAVLLSVEGGLTIKAQGLIATKLPDGKKGYSVLVVITAEGFKPVPLGLGFKLTGIGGLLAINRTFDEDVLRAGLRNRTLDSVLFPANPARDALQLLSNLNKVFPAAPGHHLFGPMVEIEWGTPTLFTMQLGIVLEIGSRLRLLVLGQIEAILPKKENDLLRIKVDAIGILDFDQGTASLDAVLYDSRLLKKFVLTGEMAMRLRWKGSPGFALAIGGLHHAFNPPANFPKLERIAINLSSGDNPRITCAAYFAVTSNTVQFGARASLYAAAHGFNIQGDIGFDVLIQLSPFHFLAEFHASIQLRRGSTNLFKVGVKGALEGPRPLRVRGKATFEILWWDVSISFDKTLVQGPPPPPPPAIDVLNELAAALGDARNWQETLPTGQRRVATVRELPAANEVRVHPLGRFGVKQTVVPLNLTRDIDKFGSSPPSGSRRFKITSITVGSVAQQPTPLTDFFAPAQFFEMTDDESIANPSFQAMEAGVVIGGEDFAFNDGDRVGAVLTYETILVDTQTSEPGKRQGGYTLDATQLFAQARFGAAGRSDTRRTGSEKFRNLQRISEVAVNQGGYVIASTEDLSAQSAPGAETGQALNFIDAQEALRKLSRENPDAARKRQVIPAYELARP